MKKYLALLAICLIFSQVVTAQKVKYSLISDDPDNYKKTSLGLSVGNLDVYKGVSIGIGVRAETVIMDNILAYASYNWAWFDQIGSEENYSYQYPEPKEGRKGYINFTVGGSYFLMDWQHKRDMRIVLKTGRVGNINIEHYTMIPGTKKHLLGIDAGFSRVNKPILLEGETPFHYQSLDNRLDLPISAGFIMGAPDQPAGNPTSVYTTSRSYNFYVGVRHRSITNLLVEFEDLGKRSSSRVYDFYADLVYSPQTTLSHVIDQEGTEWKLSGPSNSFNHFGYKIGLVRRSNRTRFMTYNFEVGKIPGLVTDKTWIESGGNISFGVTLCLNSKMHFGHSHKPKTENKTNPTPNNSTI